MKEKLESWSVKVTSENQNVIKKWYSSFDSGSNPQIGWYYGINYDGYKYYSASALPFDKILTTWQFYSQIDHYPQLKAGVDSWCVQLNDENREELRNFIKDDSYSYKNEYYYGVALDGSKIGAVGTSKFYICISTSQFREKIGNSNSLNKWAKYRYVVFLKEGLQSNRYKKFEIQQIMSSSFSGITFGNSTANDISELEKYAKAFDTYTEADAYVKANKSEDKQPENNILTRDKLTNAVVYFVMGRDDNFLVMRSGKYISFGDSDYVDGSFNFDQEEYTYEKASNENSKWLKACIIEKKFISKSKAVGMMTSGFPRLGGTYVVKSAEGEWYIVNSDRRYISLSYGGIPFLSNDTFHHGEHYSYKEASEGDAMWLDVCLRAGRIIGRLSWFKRSQFKSGVAYYAEYKDAKYVVNKEKHALNLNTGVYTDRFSFTKGRYAYTIANSSDALKLTCAISKGMETDEKYPKAKLSSNVLPISQLISGNIYFERFGDHAYIAKLKQVLSDDKYKDEFVIAIGEEEFYDTTGDTIKLGNGLDELRVATNDEITWFQACERAGKYISKEDALWDAMVGEPEKKPLQYAEKKRSGDSFQIKKPEIKVRERKPTTERFNPVIKLKI